MGDKCPKCNGSFRGPSYRSSGFVNGCLLGEHLLYVCAQCGYQEARPTKDAGETHAYTYRGSFVTEKIDSAKEEGNE